MVHVENYSALGARFFELKSLLNLAIENNENFDVLFLVLGLDIIVDRFSESRPEMAFRYSQENRVCNWSSSCLWLRLNKIITEQFGNDPILSGTFFSKIYEDFFVMGASALGNHPEREAQIGIVAERSACYSRWIEDCRNKYRKFRGEKSERQDSISFKEKYEIYEQVFLPCQSQVDKQCHVVREKKKFEEVSDEEVELVRVQIDELVQLAKKVSSRTLLVVAPFSTSPRMDPLNILSIDQVQIIFSPGESPKFYYDLDYMKKLRRNTIATRKALTEFDLPVLDLQKLFDLKMENEVMMKNIGHATDYGNIYAAKILTEKFNEMMASKNQFSPSGED